MLRYFSSVSTQPAVKVARQMDRHMKDGASETETNALSGWKELTKQMLQDHGNPTNVEKG